MKGLLHSKRFKKNFKKWLCMYVAAILMLTTVVTYSKYISSLGGTDRARITRFNVLIAEESKDGYDCSTTGETISCSANNGTKHRPTADLSYKFRVKPDVEVNTILATTIYTPTDFEIVKLIEGNTVLYDKDLGIKLNSISNIGVVIEYENGAEIEKNIITAKKNIDITSSDANDTITYEVIVRYNFNDISYEPIDGIEAIKVGYSAIQDK